jgi:probable F420-dependent oxidoreductase
MRVGVIFPTAEIGADPVAVKDYAQAVEAMGFTHLIAFDHVVLGHTFERPGGRAAYDYTYAFHEPFVLFGYLAALVPALELASGVVILPQRQTALVAKQAAEVEVLTGGGRFRLGVGLGWNPVEYEALGQDFHTRGARIEEQIPLLRQLWGNELVTFEGRWDRITDAGLNPLPPRRSIPIWLGGNDDRALRRIAQLGDGWFPIFAPGAKGEERLDRMRTYLVEEGRDPTTFGIDGMIQGTTRSPDEWARDAEWWRAQGATHCSLNTMAGGRRGADAHIEAIRRFRDAVPLAA